MMKTDQIKKTWTLRGILLIAFIGVILIVSVGGTIAWIMTSTAPIENKFMPGEVTCDIVEEKSGYTKSSIKVKNIGNTDAYMRVAIVGNWCDDAGNIVAQWTGSITPASKWEKNGYYYYCTEVVAPTELSPELLNESITGDTLPEGVPAGSHLVIDVLAQAVQSEPDTAVIAAWGFVPGSEN